MPGAGSHAQPRGATPHPLGADSGRGRLVAGGHQPTLDLEPEPNQEPTLLGLKVGTRLSVRGRTCSSCVDPEAGVGVPWASGA